jgi:hypothetical protein
VRAAVEPAKLAPPLTRFLVHENVFGVDRVRDIDGFGHGAHIHWRAELPAYLLYPLVVAVLAGRLGACKWPPSLATNLSADPKKMVSACQPKAQILVSLVGGS